MRRFWNQEKDNLLRRYYGKGDLDQLAERLGASRGAIKARAGVLGLHRKVNVHHPWTEKQLQYLIAHYADTSMEELEKHTKHCSFSIYNKAAALGLVKKGHRPVNVKPIGYERVCKEDGYVYIKVAEGKPMVLKHRYVWEQTNGPIPAGYNITFIDGNRQNCDLSNLQLISREDSARRQVYNETPEQRKARMDKCQASRNRTIRRDRVRIHFGLEPYSKLVKRW